MADEKNQEIGKKSDVVVGNIKKSGFKIKLRYWIIAAFVGAFIIFIAGFSGNCPSPDPECCTSSVNGMVSYFPESELERFGTLFVIVFLPLLIVFFIYSRMVSSHNDESKLVELGSTLGVDKRDVMGVRKTGFKIRVLQGIIVVLLSFLYSIIFRLGINAKLLNLNCPNVGYPYCCSYMGVGLLSVASASEKRKYRIAIILLSAVAFLSAMKAVPVFGQGIVYNVYRGR